MTHTLAIDCMGSDRGELPLIEGAVRFLVESRDSDVNVILVGDESLIRKQLQNLKFYEKLRMGKDTRVKVQHAPEIVEMRAAATEGVRRKNSSIAVAMRMHKDGVVNAVVSAGNTGAVMASAVLTLGRIPGVSRPAIATSFPNKLESRTVLLDAGANVDVKPENMLQFAQMGASYAEDVLKVTNPRVGLLSIGEEQSKGNDVTLASYQLLTRGSFNFIGNVEGRDILEGTADVVVCDGFIGNIILKFAESMKVFLDTRVKRQVSSNYFSRAGAILMGPFLRRIRRTFDYAEYGGAPLLGIAGNCVIAHGSSSSRAICNAVKVAHKMLVSDVNGHIKRRVETFRKAVMEQ